MQAAIHQIVTFASEPFRGNPAFVLSLDRPVPDDVVRQVADQLHEGVLSCLRRLDDGRASLTFHTPTGPHPGAGHAAAAAAHVLLAETGATEGRVVLHDGRERIVTRDGTRISVPWPLMPWKDVTTADTLSAALRVPVAEAQVADFGYVAIVDDPAAIASMDPDLDAIAQLDRGSLIVTAPGDSSDIVIRVFAPKQGLPEDPVCGTAHRIIVPYWSKRLGKSELHSLQLSPRRGDLWCRLADDTVVISGETHRFLKGSIDLRK
ncbi:PhzF family phenazine biosynthesis protein [Bauldia litoralis]|uniref:PhzF family phenazine biosynthesis protein n=1 Tax=Bauldia litoralis TaxID=665467 RepID=UPI0032653B71